MLTIKINTWLEAHCVSRFTFCLAFLYGIVFGMLVSIILEKLLC
jgi:hypothetical protein